MAINRRNKNKPDEPIGGEGKYRRLTARQIVEQDRGYAVWYVKNGPSKRVRELLDAELSPAVQHKSGSEEQKKDRLKITDISGEVTSETSFMLEAADWVLSYRDRFERGEIDMDEYYRLIARALRVTYYDPASEDMVIDRDFLMHIAKRNAYLAEKGIPVDAAMAAYGTSSHDN